MHINAPVTDVASRAYRLRWWTLGVVASSMLVIGISNSILNVALPTLQRELNATGSELQWMVNAFLLVVAGLLLTGASISDRVGRATAFRAGMVIFVGGNILALTAASAGTVIAARAIMGLAAAIMIPGSLTIVYTAFPTQERARAIGIFVGTAGLGIALGPVIGGLLIQHFNWTSIFLANIPVITIGLITSLFVVPNSRNPDAKGLDIPGAVLSSGALTVLVYGLIKGGQLGWTNNVVIGCLAGAISIGVMFVFWESHTSRPMLDMPFFRNRHFSGSVSSFIIVNFAFYGVIFSLTQYLQFVQGQSALQTGIRFLPLAVGFLIGGVSIHTGIARFGIARLAAVSFLALAVLLGGASFWGVDTRYAILGTMLLVMGYCMGGLATVNNESIAAAVPFKDAGKASAVATLCVQVGGAIGVAALGSVLSGQYTSSIKPVLAQLPDLKPQSLAIAQDSVGGATRIAGQLPSQVGEVVRHAAHTSFMDGWQLMYLVACGAMIVGMVVSFKYLPQRPRSQPDEESTTDIQPVAADLAKAAE